MSTPRDWTNLLDASSGDVRRLSYADRFTTIPVNIRENVAEHSYWVALYALMIDRDANPDDDSLVGAITVHALTHDLAECITGDVVRTFKYSTPELKKAIDKAEDKMLGGLPPMVQALYPLWERMTGYPKTVDGPEKLGYVKAVIKAADFLSLFQYLNREVLRGNHEIADFVVRMQNDLRMMGGNTAEDKNPRVANLAGIYFSMADRVGKNGTFTT